MSTRFDEAARADLRRALAAMEETAQVAPGLDIVASAPVERRRVPAAATVAGALIMVLILFVPVVLFVTRQNVGDEATPPTTSTGEGQPSTMTSPDTTIPDNPVPVTTTVTAPPSAPPPTTASPRPPACRVPPQAIETVSWLGSDGVPVDEIEALLDGTDFTTVLVPRVSTVWPSGYRVTAELVHFGFGEQERLNLRTVVYSDGCDWIAELAVMDRTVCRPTAETFDLGSGRTGCVIRTPGVVAWDDVDGGYQVSSTAETVEASIDLIERGTTILRIDE